MFYNISNSNFNSLNIKGNFSIKNQIIKYNFFLYISFRLKISLKIMMINIFYRYYLLIVLYKKE